MKVQGVSLEVTVSLSGTVLLTPHSLLLTSVARAISAMMGSRMLAVATLEVAYMRPPMMKQITTTTAQVGTVQTPKGNLFCTNCQSSSEGPKGDSATEVKGQKLSSKPRGS